MQKDTWPSPIALTGWTTYPSPVRNSPPLADTLGMRPNGETSHWPVHQSPYGLGLLIACIQCYMT